MAYKINLSGKTAIVMGLRNRESIAWAVILLLLAAGARVLVSYHRENSKIRVERDLIPSLSKSWQKRCLIVGQCDVRKEEDINNLFKIIGEKFGKLDYLVHCVAAAVSMEDIQKKKITCISQENLLGTLQLCATSFIPICRNFCELANDGASIVTVSFYGSRLFLPEYTFLGAAKAALEAIVIQLANDDDFGSKQIRVNCVSAPAVLTTSAKPFPNIENIIKNQKKRSPLQIEITQEDIAGAIFFLLITKLARGITGQVIDATGGYTTVAP